MDGMTVQQLPEVSEATMASHPGTIAERNVSAATGEAGGNTEAGRRGAKARYPDGVGSIHPAGGDAGSARSMGPDLF